MVMINHQMLGDREEMEEITRIEVADHDSIKIQIQIFVLMVTEIKIMKGALIVI